jgi:hypothetical protein
MQDSLTLAGYLSPTNRAARGIQPITENHLIAWNEVDVQASALARIVQMYCWEDANWIYEGINIVTGPNYTGTHVEYPQHLVEFCYRNPGHSEKGGASDVRRTHRVPVEFLYLTPLEATAYFLEKLEAERQYRDGGGLRHIEKIEAERKQVLDCKASNIEEVLEQMERKGTVMDRPAGYRPSDVDDDDDPVPPKHRQPAPAPKPQLKRNQGKPKKWFTNTSPIV